MFRSRMLVYRCINYYIGTVSSTLCAHSQTVNVFMCVHMTSKPCAGKIIVMCIIYGLCTKNTPKKLCPLIAKTSKHHVLHVFSAGITIGKWLLLLSSLPWSTYRPCPRFVCLSVCLSCPPFFTECVCLSCPPFFTESVCLSVMSSLLHSVSVCLSCPPFFTECVCLSCPPFFTECVCLSVCHVLPSSQCVCLSVMSSLLHRVCLSVMAYTPLHRV